jgi:hypothetical protein
MSLLHLQSLAPTNPHCARVVGYGPFSLCVIHREGLYPSSGDINGLMIKGLNHFYSSLLSAICNYIWTFIRACKPKLNTLFWLLTVDHIFIDVEWTCVLYKVSRIYQKRCILNFNSYYFCKFDFTIYTGLNIWLFYFLSHNEFGAVSEFYNRL